MVWWTVAGVALIALTLGDVFHTLFHPEGRGRLSDAITRSSWAVSRRTGHRWGSVAGPLGTILTITAWIVLVSVGWALVYLPHVPHGFVFAPGVEPGAHADLAEAMYLSLTTVSTLGFGDVVPVEAWMRWAAPIQGIVGFALLTAALAWVMQIYPALHRRRSLALRLTLMHRSEYGGGIHRAGSVTASQLLDALTSEVVGVRVDLSQNSETFYYRDASPRTALPTSLAYACRLRERATASDHGEVRESTELFGAALDDLADVLRDRFSLRGDTTPQVFADLAREHGHDYPEEV